MKKLIKIWIFVIVLLTLGMHTISAIEVSIVISEKYEAVEAGEDIYFEIELIDREAIGRHDISLEYEVIYENEVIAFLKELKAIETQASFVESIKIPENAESGMHSVKVTVNEQDSAAASFYVKSVEEENLQVYFIIIAVIILVVGSLIWNEIHKTRKGVEQLR